MALEPVEAEQPKEKVEYVCPMHAQIVRDRPGNCPICGMALEPRTVTAGEEGSPELADMTRRFWISAALTIPLVALSMAEYIPGRPLDRLISRQVLVWIQLILSTPVIVWGGWPFFTRAWVSVIVWIVPSPL